MALVPPPRLDALSSASSGRSRPSAAHRSGIGTLRRSAGGRCWLPRRQRACPSAALDERVRGAPGCHAPPGTVKTPPPPVERFARGSAAAKTPAVHPSPARSTRAVRSVLYTDVDGTLVGPLGNFFWTGDRTPTLAAAEALVRAASEGLQIVPISGRSRIGMFEVARLLGIPSWICELGGIRVYDRGEEIVHDHGAFPGQGPPTAELWEAARGLFTRYPGR